MKCERCEGKRRNSKRWRRPLAMQGVQQAFNADNFQQKIKIVAAESKNLSQSRIYFSSIILNTFPVQKMLLLREMENQVNVIATLYTFHLSTNHLMQFIHLCYWFDLSIYLLSLSLSSFVYLHVFVCNCSSFQFWDAYRFFSFYSIVEITWACFQFGKFGTFSDSIQFSSCSCCKNPRVGFSNWMTWNFSHGRLDKT